MVMSSPTTATTTILIIIIVTAGVSAAIDSIVPHAFGEHSKCGHWCQFLKDEKAKHRTLPNGLDLQGDTLRTELTSIFKIFSQNAAKLAPCGSTLANESFNNSVASKAPKVRHYSGSESLDYRVKAAACQKNLGHGYVEMVRFLWCHFSFQLNNIIVQRTYFLLL